MSQEDYEQGSEELSNIHQQAKLIPGTQKFHCFVPISENKIAAKLYSSDEAVSYYNVYRKVKT